MSRGRRWRRIRTRWTTMNALLAWGNRTKKILISSACALEVTDRGRYKRASLVNSVVIVVFVLACVCIYTHASAHMLCLCVRTQTARTKKPPRLRSDYVSGARFYGLSRRFGVKSVERAGCCCCSQHTLKKLPWSWCLTKEILEIIILLRFFAEDEFITKVDTGKKKFPVG